MNRHSDINPSQYAIDAEYNRLLDLSTAQVAALIPWWRVSTAYCGCCEFLLLYSPYHPNATMIAAGELLAERLSVTRDMIRWEPLKLHS